MKCNFTVDGLDWACGTDRDSLYHECDEEVCGLTPGHLPYMDCHLYQDDDTVVQLPFRDVVEAGPGVVFNWSGHIESSDCSCEPFVTPPFRVHKPFSNELHAWTKCPDGRDEASCPQCQGWRGQCH